MLLNLGQVPTLVVSSADMVKEMTKNHDVVFSNRPATTSSDILFYGGKMEEEVAAIVDKIRKASLTDQLFEEHKAVLESNGRSEIKDFMNVLLQVQKDGNLNFELTRNNIKAILARIGMVYVRAFEESKGDEESPRRGKKSGREKGQDRYERCESNELLKMCHERNPKAASTGSILVPRETSESIELGGYHIPANTQVLVNGWAIQRDPSSWERPEEFIPERFENSSIEMINGQDFRYIPFGVGRRACPGWIFAVASIEYLMANLLFWFDWKLVGDDAMVDDLDMSEAQGVSGYKKVPLHLVPLPPCSS
ncbi:hypothetical protein FNV43_RR21048 [Rhamnella rubrinervis]|uniref:Cytochrome P450 n=1 Tax=Rhamnella rubrinervis TaxID=2594499 RepID=A0A8K0E0Y8_9ROSA|nr:hypothetical protein FNV43_RR21048 [Rhamnella rubrinervis]